MSQRCHQGYLGLGLRIKFFNRKPALHTVGFERSGHSGGREGLIKHTINLHYGKCSFIVLWTKSQDISANAAVILAIPFLNLSLVISSTLCALLSLSLTDVYSVIAPM